MNGIFFNRYFSKINKSIELINSSELEGVAEVFLNAHKNNNKIIFVGNGGSATISSHMTIDFINAVGIRAVNFNDSALITCFSNDYGYENWIEKALECHADSGDVLVLISSSGKSENMVVGAKKGKSLGLDVITLTGFSVNNSLKEWGDINLWTDSNEYNIVEMTHHVWLLSIADFIIENSQEKVV